jgi:EmrB/QacA subfamily drug resistance transporter
MEVLPTHAPPSTEATMIATALHPSAALSHRQVTRVMIGIALCILLSALDQTIVVPAVPAMARDLRGFGQLSWIVSVYLLTSAAATPILGKLSDSHGRRNLLLVSIAFFTLCSLLCAAAADLPEMVLFRALQGIGGAGLLAMSHATVADVASPRERGRYQIYLSGTWGVASIVGPLTGGFLTDHLSWRAIFWINLPLGAAAFLISWWALAQLPRQARRVSRIDYPGAALLTLAVVAGLLVLSWGGDAFAWNSATILGLGAMSATAVALLAVWERASAEALFPPRLFAQGAVASGFALSFFNAVCMMGATFLLPLFFQFARGSDAASSGTRLMPFLFAFVVFSYAGGRLATRIGRTKWLMVLASAVTAAGLALLAADRDDAAGYRTALYAVMTGGGIGLIQPCITMTVQNGVEIRDLGIATSGTLLFRMIGGAFGATLVGAVVTGQFNARMAALGVTTHATLGTMRGGDVAGGAVPHALVEAAMGRGFHWAFLGCAAAALLGMTIALAGRDPVLRAAPAPQPGAAPKKAAE